MAQINLKEYSKDIWDIVQDGLRRQTIQVGPYLSFTDLKGSPTSYVGKAGYVVTVNADEDGLELTPP